PRAYPPTLHDALPSCDRLAPDRAADPVAALAFAHSHPQWIAQAFADALGADAGELGQALAADNAAPHVHLVARPGEISAEELALDRKSTRLNSSHVSL